LRGLLRMTYQEAMNFPVGYPLIIIELSRLRNYR